MCFGCCDRNTVELRYDPTNDGKQHGSEQKTASNRSVVFFNHWLFCQCAQCDIVKNDLFTDYGINVGD